jgi:mannose-6-phosphate isomerase-like protein (cupin superfamily)
MPTRIRRVVTAQNDAGRSYILQDQLAPNQNEVASMPGLAITELWETLNVPANNEGTADGADRPIRHEPPRGGTLFRTVEFPPDEVWRGSVDSQKAFDSIGGGHTRDTASDDPMMHKSDTIDYVAILSGEIHAVMEEGEVLLKAGDVLVQRGTKHSWSNRSGQNCLLAVVLVSADPI